MLGAKRTGGTVFFKNRLLSTFVSATGVSLLIQALAFSRQVIIAASFGVTRELDGYVVIYAVATYAVFTFGTVFDWTAVPHLVRVRENEGPDAAFALALSLFRASLALGAVASVLFLILLPLLSPIVATGFAPAEKRNMTELAWYFLPWTLVYVPFYAVAARYKMEWRFNRVFAAEIVVIVVSIVVLALWHDDIRYLPIAYAAGYATALLLLLVGAGLLWPPRRQHRPRLGIVCRNIAELFVANQSSNISGIIDRHIQSFVPAGGVSAINYSAQVTNALAGLLTFRDVFAVPLAHEQDRAVKLERLLCGLALVATPLAGVVACLAPDVVAMLFQRGRFDASATTLTAQVLRINAIGVILGAMWFPLLRTFQIIDRINLTWLLYLSLAISSAIFGYLFVVELELGVQGVAMMQVASSAIVCLIAASLIDRCGIRLDWRRILGHLLFASLASGAAFLLASIAISGLENTLVRLAAGGGAYSLTIVGCYALARSQLRGIAFGAASGASSTPP
jgi:putative peptidoglycan lipid II flippase